MLASLLIPALILLAGPAVGLSAALLARRFEALRAPILRIPLIALTVTLLVHGVMFTLEALRYSGGCSGWGERGSYPCTRLEFALQDWDIALLVSAVPTLVAIALAFVAFSQLRPRQSA